MKMNTLIAASIVAAFAIPFSAGAAGDKATTSSSGAEKMFQSLDKNKDGYLSKDEAKGTPHDKDFAALDKNRDGKLSRQEHAAAPEHAGDKSTSTGGTSGGSMSSGAAGGSAPAAPGSRSGSGGESQGKGAKY
jgi:hypothetical protein